MTVLVQAIRAPSFTLGERARPVIQRAAAFGLLCNAISNVGDVRFPAIAKLSRVDARPRFTQRFRRCSSLTALMRLDGSEPERRVASCNG